jgi:hypothetical protein
VTRAQAPHSCGAAGISWVRKKWLAGRAGAACCYSHLVFAKAYMWAGHTRVRVGFCAHCGAHPAGTRRIYLQPPQAYVNPVLKVSLFLAAPKHFEPTREWYKVRSADINAVPVSGLGQEVKFYLPPEAANHSYSEVLRELKAWDRIRIRREDEMG